MVSNRRHNTLQSLVSIKGTRASPIVTHVGHSIASWRKPKVNIYGYLTDWSEYNINSSPL